MSKLMNFPLNRKAASHLGLERVRSLAQIFQTPCRDVAVKGKHTASASHSNFPA